MTVTLIDPSTGRSLELLHGNEANTTREGEAEASPLPGKNSEGTFLTQLTDQKRASIFGSLSSVELSRRADYPDDPREALGEWAVRFLAFLNGGQGDGYTLDLDYRNNSYQGYIESQQYTITGGEPYSLDYNLTFALGTGYAPNSTLTFPDASPTGTWSVDETTLPSINEAQVLKRVNLEVTRRAFQENPEDNDITTAGGAVREVTITGEYAGTVPERNTFDAAIEDTIGQDTIVTLKNGLTGETYEGMIETYEPTDTAGVTRYQEYALQFIEGTQ